VNHPHLLVLAVDQRPWLTQALYAHTGRATPDQRASICRGKHMVLDGLLAAVEAGVDQAATAILVDATLGPGVPERARAHGVTVSIPLERAGLDVYEDEPDDVGAYLAYHQPDLAKVLVRYNPEGDRESNRLQLSRLTATARAVRDAGSRFLFELLVPPTPAQLAATGSREAFDHQVRPGLILRGMEELSAAFPVDVWKLEHLAEPPGYADAAGLAASTGGECILLGAGAPADVVDGWLSDAARAGFTGFAIGRSIWWDAMRDLLDGSVDHGTAVNRVAERYARFVSTFQRLASPVEDVAVAGSGS
jgi:myo-inositol catabolism protein IolC